MRWFSGLVGIMVFVFSSHAQTTFTDRASNYGGAGQPGFTNGANAGNGFNAWTIASGTVSTNGFAGNFVGSPGNAGTLTNFTTLYTGGNAFSIYAGGEPGAFTDAGRVFTSSLAVGDIFRHSMGFSFDNGNKGFDLRSGGNGVFNFNISSGRYDFSGAGTNGLAMTSWGGVREQGVVINFAFTRTSTGLNYAINSLQDSALNVTGSVAAAGLDEIKYYISGAGGGDGGNLWFNNLEIQQIPEPSSFSLLALGATGLLALRRLRKST